MQIQIESFYDTRTHTVSYVVFHTESRDAIAIDPVLDYDPGASKVWTESADAMVAFVRREKLRLHYILETHAHADHLSGSQVLKTAFPEAKTAIGSRITEVQEIFKERFQLPAEFPTDGSQFDELLRVGTSVAAGTLRFDVIGTPGHTPACVTYRFDDAIFTGDTLFMPDMGTGRCDFPGGSANDLYDSVMRLYELPDSTRVFVGHDYQPGGRELAYVASIADHKERNVALPVHRDREDFVQWRQQRDAQLSAPKLLFQSVQVNVDAGNLPAGGYLKIPINVFRPVADKEALEYDTV